MADESKTKSRLEIAHVLFMDIVDYSKLLTDEQSEALQELNQIVPNTEAARAAAAAGQLTILPTGDGMALVFTGSVGEPFECALEISHALPAGADREGARSRSFNNGSGAQRTFSTRRGDLHYRRVAHRTHLRACDCVSDFSARDHAHARQTRISDPASAERRCIHIVGR